MNIENFFTETDYESLTLNSSITKRYPLVVKDNIFDEKISNLCYDELQQLQLHTTLLQPSSMGSRDHNWHNTIFRGKFLQHEIIRNYDKYRRSYMLDYPIIV